MNPRTDNKLILVVRPTRLDDLVKRFNTVAQARFYVEHSGADFSDYLREHEIYQQARRTAEDLLGTWGRLHVLDRGFLPNFIFGPNDTVVVLGQDGLVANTLKYLTSQPVIGVNPDPTRWDGRLLPFKVDDLAVLPGDVFCGTCSFKKVTLAQVTLNNGQTLRAVNDLFLGPKSHGSARYEIASGGRRERQSSSGVIVSTGMGSTGWFASLMAGARGISEASRRVLGDGTGSRKLPPPPSEFAWDSGHLFFTVREPFPSHTTGTSLVFGRVTAKNPLQLVSEMPEHGVIFSDGMEQDFLDFNSGTTATVSLAPESGRLVA